MAMANNTTIQNDAWTCMDIHSISSNNMFQSTNPLYYSTNILLLQSSLATFMASITSALFLPLGIPPMVTQLMAGISLGPNVLGHIKNFQRYVFPPRSYILLRAYGRFGPIIQLFLIGVQTDASALFKAGKKGVIIGISVFLVPFALTRLCSIIIANYINDDTNDLVNNIAVVGKLESLTTFSVIVNYLIELNILNVNTESEFNNLALSSSMVSGLLGYTAIGAFLHDERATNYIAFFSLLAIYAVVGVVIIVIIAPTVKRVMVIKKRATPDGKQESLNVVISLVFVAAYLCYKKNINMAHGAFAAGLIIPPGPPLGSVLIEKFYFYNKWMVMPVFYAVDGINTIDIFEGGSKTSFLVVLIILISFLGKFLGAFVPALFFNMSYKDASLLGLTMNAQGLLEVQMFTYINKSKMIDNECLTTMLLSMVITTGASAPLMGYLYKLTSFRYKLIHNIRTIQNTVPDSELRVLACVYEDENVPTMIEVLKATNPTRESPIKLSVIHFVELVGDHTTPLVISHKVHRNLPPAAAVSEHIVNVFKYYEETNKEIFAVHPYTVVSNYPFMHNDVRTLALHQKTSLIILPYHKSSATGYVNSGIRTVNYSVLDKSPCSVGILIDRGLHNSARFVKSWILLSYRVAVIFLGGADDREALAHAKRMSVHSAIELTVFQFFPSKRKGNNGSDFMETSLDDAMIKDFKLDTTSNNQVRYIEEEVEKGVGVIKVIKAMKDKFDLIILGRRHDENLSLIVDITDWTKCSELGTIGDIFMTSGYGGNATLLVIQQHSKVDVPVRSQFLQDGVSRYDVDREVNSF